MLRSVSIFLFLLLCETSQGSAQITGAPSQGMEAPLFLSRDMRGDIVDLNSLKGQKVFLNFWASYSQESIAQIPRLKKIRSENPVQLQLISVSLDDQDEEFYRAVRKNAMNWTVIYADKSIPEIYAVDAVPVNILIDEKGKILWRSSQQQPLPPKKFFSTSTQVFPVTDLK